MTLELGRNLELKLTARPAETPEQFRAALRSGGRGRGGRRDGQDQAEARGSEGTAREGARPRAATGRGADHGRALTACERADRGAGAVLGALLGGRRSTRSIAGAASAAASRRGMSSRTSARRQTAEGKVERAEDELEALEQEILDEVQAIDEKWKAIAGADRRRVNPTRSRRRQRRATCRRLGADVLRRRLTAVRDANYPRDSRS